MSHAPEAARAAKSLAQDANYSTGEPAVRLDGSGCGFCYYVSGRVAACASKVSDYQRSFQFYEDNAKKSLLGMLDEHAVGSAGHPRRKKLILTKESGIVMNAENVIVKSWKWDPKAQHAGTPPTEPVTIQLNDSLLFTYRDRSSIVVTFTPCPGVSVEFACGEQLRRTDTYLEHAHRVTDGPQRGKLLIDQRTPTLQQRQKLIELESIEKRSKQKPRSVDLSDERLKAIVSTLETKFDGYEGCRVTPAADGNWRENAHQQCLREIPILPKTGAEVGQEPTLFGAPVKENDSSESLRRLKHGDTGKWLGSVELHTKITMENPVLKRGGPLTSAGGRYSRELSVVGGGAKPNGEHLKLLSAHRLDEFLKEMSASDQLIIVACLRTDDPQSRVVEGILEQIQLQISESKRAAAASAPGSSATDVGIRHRCRLVKCDLGESPLLADRYRIRAAPTFLMFYEGRLVHVTSLGGTAVRVAPATKNAHLSNQMDQLPRVLLVEKTIKQQVAIEKLLKKEAFQWDLANHGEQAVSYFTQMPRSATGYGIVMLSDTLDDFEVRSIDRFVRHKDKSRPSESLVCVVVSSPLGDVQFASGMCNDCRRSQGRRISSASSSETRKTVGTIALACPHCGILVAESTTNLLPAVLADVGHVFVYKHVKAATLHRLAELWLARHNSSSKLGAGDTDGHFLGLTVDSFFKEMERHLASGKRGVFLPEHHVPPMALSANDTALLASGPVGGGSQASGMTVNVLRSSSA